MEDVRTSSTCWHIDRPSANKLSGHHQAVTNIATHLANMIRLSVGWRWLAGVVAWISIWAGLHALPATLADSPPIRAILMPIGWWQTRQPDELEAASLTAIINTSRSCKQGQQVSATLTGATLMYTAGAIHVQRRVRVRCSALSSAESSRACHSHQ